MTNQKSTADKLRALAEFSQRHSMGAWMKSEHNVGEYQFSDGGKAENARLKVALLAAADVVDRLKRDTDHMTCVCRLNPLVGKPVPCDTCLNRATLAKLAEVLK